MRAIRSAAPLTFLAPPKGMRTYEAAAALAGPLEPLTARLALHLGLTRAEAARLRELGVRYALERDELWAPDAPCEAVRVWPKTATNSRKSAGKSPVQTAAGAGSRDRPESRGRAARR